MNADFFWLYIARTYFPKTDAPAVPALLDQIRRHPAPRKLEWQKVLHSQPDQCRAFFQTLSIADDTQREQSLEALEDSLQSELYGLEQSLDAQGQFVMHRYRQFLA